MTEAEFIASMNSSADKCARLAYKQRKTARPLMVMCAASVIHIAAVCFLTESHPALCFFCGLCVGIISMIGVVVYFVSEHTRKSLMDSRQQALDYKAQIVAMGCFRREEEE